MHNIENLHDLGIPFLKLKASATISLILDRRKKKDTIIEFALMFTPKEWCMYVDRHFWDGLANILLPSYVMPSNGNGSNNKKKHRIRLKVAEAFSFKNGIHRSCKFSMLCIPKESES